MKMWKIKLAAWMARQGHFSCPQIPHPVGISGFRIFHRRPDIGVLWDVFGRRIYETDARPKAVIDVGGHIGAAALFFSRRAESVFIFEPDHKNLALFDLNIGQMKTPYKLIKAAAWSRKTSLELRQGATPAASSVVTGQGSGVKVPAITLDSLRLKPDFIKINVEGAAADVLKGAAKTVEKHQPALAIELDGPIPPVKRLLREYGYADVRIFEGHLLYANCRPLARLGD